MGKSIELYQICWDLEHGKITSNEAHSQILCLLGVKNSEAVLCPECGEEMVELLSTYECVNDNCPMGNNNS